MKTIKLSADLLNYYGCLHNDCVVDGEKHHINPDEVYSSLIHGGIDDKADSFQSPLYELGKKLEDAEPTDLEEITFTGDGNSFGVDLSWWKQLYEYHRFPEVYKRLPFNTKPNNGRRIIRMEGEFEMIEHVDQYLLESYSNYLYINNYYENVDVYGVDKNNNHLFFRAPKPNVEPADGKLVMLTEAYSDWNHRHHSKYFWSKPITLHSNAVTHIEEIELDCYESHQHKGTRLYFIGIVPKELTKEEKEKFIEGYPFVDVWESPEFVVEKLKQARWHLE